MRTWACSLASFSWFIMVSFICESNKRTHGRRVRERPTAGPAAGQVGAWGSPAPHTSTHPPRPPAAPTPAPPQRREGVCSRAAPLRRCEARRGSPQARPATAFPSPNRRRPPTRRPRPRNNLLPAAPPPHSPAAASVVPSRSRSGGGAERERRGAGYARDRVQHAEGTEMADSKKAQPPPQSACAAARDGRGRPSAAAGRGGASSERRGAAAGRVPGRGRPVPPPPPQSGFIPRIPLPPRKDVGEVFPCWVEAGCKPPPRGRDFSSPSSAPPAPRFCPLCPRGRSRAVLRRRASPARRPGWDPSTRPSPSEPNR